jgi:hypothetical protein
MEKKNMVQPQLIAQMADTLVSPQMFLVDFLRHERRLICVMNG